MEQANDIRALTTLVVKTAINLSTSYVISMALGGFIPYPTGSIAKIGYSIGRATIAAVLSRKVTNEMMDVLNEEMLAFELMMAKAKAENQA